MSENMTSSGEYGLNIRTNESLKMGQDQVSGGVSFLNCSFFIRLLSYSNNESSRSIPVTFIISLSKVFKQTFVYVNNSDSRT